MRVILQPAYILHQRAFRETSLLLDLFTKDHGRITAVARGVRASRSRWRPLLHLFVPLLVSWQGKSELMTLIDVETQGAPMRLQGDRLLSAFYVNELMVRLLQKHDPHPSLFNHYTKTLRNLDTEALDLNVLRLFEKNLLEELGYGLPLAHDYITEQPLLADKKYHYHHDHGFTEAEDGDFQGDYLIAFANGRLECDEGLHDIKRLMRKALARLLGDQPLQSRDLFKK